ncbi:retinal tissue protein [Holotrichia oblita]|uniref:Retinal tissue protein n=1 Tax=Holotrichia oblita TaxID=644536 RepID=A0ACB9TYF6_HOLOL|nr:retinal tissue protein [Holotrichia oblita]
MATEKPGSVQQAGKFGRLKLLIKFQIIKVTFCKAVKMRIDFSAEDSAFTEFEESLLSMENLDRSSPELWPEKIPGMNEIMSIFTPPTAAKLPYSKDFTPEDQTYLHRKYISTL